MEGDGHLGTKTEDEAAEEGTENQDDIVAVFERHRGEHHIVVLHDYPDPDAISSAFAHQLISAEFDIQADLVYNGRISHQQNIALVKLLGINPLRFDEVKEDLGQYDGSVFVDNQGTACEAIVEALEAVDVPVVMVIDHHETQERLTAEFTDCRYVGATATIYAGYLEHGLLDLNKGQRDHLVVATALTHGIMTDTGDFIRAGAEDFQAAAFLSRYRDSEVLLQIMSQSRSKQTMEVIRRALGNRVVTENFSITGIGYLRAEDRDAIPQAADFLLTEENVHTAIVYGMVSGSEQGERLVGSMRTSKITLDPDDFIKEVFGKDQQGHYVGGGKEAAGAFEMPVGFLSDGQGAEFRELKWQVYDSQVKQKLFAKIGVESPAQE
jgi:nanoRNase/pAp phosphatase (c-di-AMP/oligoRNAs hydrolase)